MHMSNHLKSHSCAAALVLSVLVATPAQAWNLSAAIVAANGPACEPIRPFYWEIGDTGVMPIGSGQVGGTTYNRTTTVDIASASKWIFGAYVFQASNGVPSNTQVVQALGMQKGYISFNPVLCALTSTVSACQQINNNDVQDPAAVGHFHYNGGDGQWAAATQLGLGGKTNATLLAEINAKLSLGPSFAFNNPQLAGGMRANAQDYAAFLKKLMNGTYVAGQYLSYSPYATQPCHNGSNCSPFGTVPHHYSMYHWIEDGSGGTYSNGAPGGTGDGTFSSAGARGFYPWISSNKGYYGIISREGPPGSGEDSQICGKAIRAAFFSV